MCRSVTSFIKPRGLAAHLILGMLDSCSPSVDVDLPRAGGEEEGFRGLGGKSKERAARGKGSRPVARILFMPQGGSFW